MYNPFSNFDFTYKKCFLSGNATEIELIQVPVIPKWLLAQAELTGEEQIKLLDESIRTYNSLHLPINAAINNDSLIPLEEKMETTFEEGFSAVSILDESELFIWLGKFLYGFIYAEMHAAIRTQGTAEGLNMSQSLIKKFGTLQLFLQKLYKDMVFENFKPWSIKVVKLADKETKFSFRDEINTLTFSLKFRDFGIIACLQDNGTNALFHQNILSEIDGKELSAKQFEELCARFYYSAYLFNRLPDYTVVPLDETLFIEPMPLRGISERPLFDVWQHKIYAQVLEHFLMPWDISRFEILKNPEKPMSYFDRPSLPAGS